MDLDERAQQMYETRQLLTQAQHEFGIKYGFRFHRVQDYKNCVVIRWKYTEPKYQMIYSRLEEYHQIARELSDKYDLWNRDMYIEVELRVLKAGIYCVTEGVHHTWAIPNEFSEVQEFVLSRVPEWAQVRIKDERGRTKTA